MDDSSSRAQAHWQYFDASQTAAQSTTTDAADATQRISPDTDSFNKDTRNSFGQNLRLAMAFMDRAATPPPSTRPESAMPHQAAAIVQRLKSLGKDITSNTADQLELLVRFDELEGWRSSGARHCVAWMNIELGIGLQLGWEYLRVGRQLRHLPIVQAMFRSGSLGWSKVRLISRVANAENEGGLCHAGLDASVSEVERYCNEYRWNAEGSDEEGSTDTTDAENARYLQQFNARSLIWNTASNGNTAIHLLLPAELAQAFLQSIEHSLQQLDVTDESMPQRRADAAVLMAEAGLQVVGKSVSSADRYQVIVSVDASQLKSSAPFESTAYDSEYTNKSDKSDARSCDANTDYSNDKNAARIVERYSEASHSEVSHSEVSRVESRHSDSSHNEVGYTEVKRQFPVKRPTLPGGHPIAQETARRIACDCSVSTIAQSNGEPLSIGRKSRLWAPAMARAIKVRDQHCQFPGCAQTRHLQIHHIKHWADGGSTSVDNGVCLCQKHHIIVHEGGFRVERVADKAQGLDDQFDRQSAAAIYGQSSNCVSKVEAMLRNSRESFGFVRQLSPTRFRFRFVNESGCDFRDTKDISSSVSSVCLTHTSQRKLPQHDIELDPTDQERSATHSTYVVSSTLTNNSTHADSSTLANDSTHADSSTLTNDSTHADSSTLANDSTHVDSSTLPNGSAHVNNSMLSDGSTRVFGPAPKMHSHSFDYVHPKTRQDNDNPGVAEHAVKYEVCYESSYGSSYDSN